MRRAVRPPSAQSRAAYEAMIRQHSPDGTVRGFVERLRLDPGGPAARAYRLWVLEVLMPLNDAAQRVVTGGAHLLDSSFMPGELLQLVAHTSAIKVAIRRWEEGELEAWSAISYPDGLLSYIQREVCHSPCHAFRHMHAF